MPVACNLVICRGLLAGSQSNVILICLLRALFGLLESFVLVRSKCRISLPFVFTIAVGLFFALCIFLSFRCCLVFCPFSSSALFFAQNRLYACFSFFVHFSLSHLLLSSLSYLFCFAGRRGHRAGLASAAQAVRRAHARLCRPRQPAAQSEAATHTLTLTRARTLTVPDTERDTRTRTGTGTQRRRQR